MIDNKTGFFGLLGFPLEHSFSAAMHNYAYSKMNINYIYLPLEVRKEGLKKAVEGIRELGFLGFNITIPYKMEIIKYLDEIDPLAEKIGSVNTVRVEKGKLKGFNTDGEGFVMSVENELDSAIARETFFIIGAGGASRGIAMTLAAKNPERIYITNRTAQKAEDLCREINSRIKDCCISVVQDSDEMAEAVGSSDILINTTSVGMFPDTESSPVDSNFFHKDLKVADIVYNPLKTKLMKEAEGKGCKTINGLGMLVNQGAKAFEIWTGMEPPYDYMREGLEKFINENSRTNNN